MVSIKIVLLLVVVGAFVIGGGVGIASGALDRIKFEATKVRTSLNKRGETS